MTFDSLRKHPLYVFVALSVLVYLIYNLLCINYFRVKGHLTQTLYVVFVLKMDKLISLNIFLIETLQVYFYLCSQFEVGIALGLGNINHTTLASKQRHTGH